MDCILPKDMKVLIQWLDKVEYVRKGGKGDHNIQFQKNCNHQEDQRVQFHDQVAGEIICPIHG